MYWDAHTDGFQGSHLHLRPARSRPAVPSCGGVRKDVAALARAVPAHRRAPRAKPPHGAGGPPEGVSRASTRPKTPWSLRAPSMHEQHALSSASTSWLRLILFLDRRTLICFAQAATFARLREHHRALLCEQLLGQHLPLWLAAGVLPPAAAGLRWSWRRKTAWNGAQLELHAERYLSTNVKASTGRWSSSSARRRCRKSPVSRFA
jgi:hypothetical protein